MKNFFDSRPLRIVSILLLVETLAFYGFPKADLPRTVHPLAELPTTLGAWSMTEEYPIEAEVQAVLKADDTLSRTYAGPTGSGASLFIAFFKTQSTGVAPHSPRNCLPGSGWIPTNYAALPIPIPGRAEPIVVNRYFIERGESRSLVLYWYQTGSRVVGNEYSAKLYTIADRVLHRRSDTSLVRIVVPLDTTDPAPVQRTTADFARLAYSALLRVLPQ
jgi:EpsI family protein